MATLIAYPLIALLVGAIFVGVWFWRRARTAALAGLLWLMYGGYEYLMHARILCSGECNIRVDLLVLYPLLFAVSLVAIWRSARASAARGGRSDFPA